MRVYISIDMEGVAGIATMDQVVRGGHGYPRAQQLMTGEANAAIEGAFAGGATEVTINDSHGTMDNLIHEDLDQRARVVFGSPKVDCMAEGIDKDHDVALFIGYHAAAGGPGVIAHTYSSLFNEVRVNGTPVSEADVNALQAAAVGVPVALLTGDDVICADIATSLPGIHTVTVKEAHGYNAADSVSPTESRRLIHDAAKRAVEGAGELALAPVPEIIEAEIDMPNIPSAELAQMIPTAERTAIRTIKLTARSPREAVNFITACYQFAAASLRGMLPLINR
ncbi:M55 family metallopeptidase [Leucobacter aridicollis]|uniref:D-amino peptidase n=1 Tax=Leucobacter aridicollis TaxID=283878 RepID=A0A852R797_9MICO|nr:M55 family metallopeptidase [Leucobacter aridicollis]MBL3682861.1 aminopeptidase [Leucobacter aridicollis]NYD26299.1 D-amino peptidase [Leucobacter aridicollis]